jgi:hypothetical protein
MYGSPTLELAKLAIGWKNDELTCPILFGET